MDNKTSVLTKALLNATKNMGISQTYLGNIIGKNKRELICDGIHPDSKAGELSLMLIRCYRSLYVLVGDNSEQISHWMQTHNKGTHGIPIRQISRIDGLVHITEYLDAIRGKS